MPVEIKRYKWSHKNRYEHYQLPMKRNRIKKKPKSTPIKIPITRRCTRISTTHAN
ncbi:hypothetical protein DPMN_127482 [Dreissena polymorpha]|uniref:Uncharacterized protein n=1 Tax=Dreissena polymorpha TaxID=45954 RepID=A0A9D4GXQ0_DREPO|nr:hypothetical protein DPMN_127482 [Dreissena polymorpha]